MMWQKNQARSSDAATNVAEEPSSHISNPVKVRISRDTLQTEIDTTIFISEKAKKKKKFNSLNIIY